ncbi:NACHT domain-containing protein [Variovorax sp.]|jgi:hypothetical protein|uniref:NACHT domain-containing protein n=1 Tax=Variovorax sp. TaxID=1871043 RepID=UPI00121D9ABE|nr:NACHT domain-containing protein [Variovorax sp.]TAJ67733.1 MAG: NACHT domain-containing protein [Variovorax sp.]
MAVEKESANLSEFGLNVFNALWEWTGTSETWRVAIVGVLLAAVLLGMLASCLGALSKVVDSLIKLLEAIRASGVPRFMKREDRIKIRRRSQFCAVLEADLTSIAKAESWNDQYFTDLEAEVETEGGYYISALHRFLGKVTTGLRKEKSLIKAISSSTERAIQLTGEPGSGKSVALRHLASQLAVRAKASKSKNIRIPLYVNLREISVPAGTSINTDTIRDFILDNIRRGDSDTTAYVRENWADYRERGIWFFLFDSFDEIPAVLHAEKGSPATRDYAEAIRMFLEGMGACGGILASREFKGPESLPWKKFRILRLTSSKQQELVKNSFLSQVQERAVLHHIAANKSTLANTPLFLTLLCRYVKEASEAPRNDYELLSLQIDRLAHRDPTYLKRAYGLTPANLLAGAQRFARLFAEESSLGLAPTIDQVEAVLDKSEIPGGEIQRFVAAMVDSKIARADVANAAPGDRRFAFAHRRYQEALFVRHLVAHPNYLSSQELLTDPRWREYAVTLLETQPTENLADIFKTATQLLLKESVLQRRQDALAPIQKYCGYFDWSGEIPQMLTLLQEGLVRRVSALPSDFSFQVEQFLKVRWETGDSFDRLRVMQVASLLPQLTLSNYLKEVFLKGSDKAQNEGFNQTTSLVGPFPSSVRQAVLKRLANEILGAKDASSLLRVEALAARLPRDLGAEYVQRRCLLLWRLTTLVNGTALLAFPKALTRTLLARFDLHASAKEIATERTRAALVFGTMVITYIPVLLSVAVLGKRRSAELTPAIELLFVGDSSYLASWISKGTWIEHAIVIFSFAVTLIYLVFPVLFRFRATGEPLSASFFARRLRRKKAILETGQSIGIALLGVSAAGAVAYLLGWGMSFLSHYALNVTLSTPNILLGIAALAILSVIFFIIVAILLARWKHKSQQFYKAALAETSNDHFLALLSAQDWEQLESWLKFWEITVLEEEKIKSTEEKSRSLSAMLQHSQRGGIFPDSIFLPTSESNPKIQLNCINTIEKINSHLGTLQFKN